MSKKYGFSVTNEIFSTSIEQFGTSIQLNYHIADSTIEQDTIENEYHPIDEDYKNTFKTTLEKSLHRIIDDSMYLSSNSVGMAVYKDNSFPHKFKLVVNDAIVAFHIRIDKDTGLTFVISNKENLIDKIQNQLDGINYILLQQNLPKYKLTRD